MVRKSDSERTHAVHFGFLADIRSFSMHVHTCMQRCRTTLARRAPFACMASREKRAKSKNNGTMITFVVHRAIV